MTDIWQQMCAADGLDPVKRLTARQAVLNDPHALDATLYRSDESGEEELDLGDAKVLFQGAYVLPAHWSANEKAEYLDGALEDELLCALVECQADPQSKDYFVADVGDYLACVETTGKVAMYFVHDFEEDNNGRRCILIQDQ